MQQCNDLSKLTKLQITSLERRIFPYAVRAETPQWPNCFDVMTGIKQDWSDVPVPHSSGRRLDYEDMHNTENKWNPADTVNETRKLGLCQRSGDVIPQPTDAREDQ